MVCGEYAPRGAWPRSDPIPTTLGLSVDDLRREFDAYGPFLIAGGLKPSGVPTYVEGAHLFLKWLDPDIVAKGSRPPAAPARPPREPPRPPAAVGAGVTPKDPHDWPSETFVQAAVVGWLAAGGWRIERVAHTSSRSTASMYSPAGMACSRWEAKGYPSDVYTTGEHAGQPRKWHPASQARTYFGDALLAVLSLRDETPAAVVLLALPDIKGYRGLLDKVGDSLGLLQIQVAFVARDGSVDGTLPGAPDPLPDRRLPRPLSLSAPSTALQPRPPSFLEEGCCHEHSAQDISK